MGGTSPHPCESSSSSKQTSEQEVEDEVVLDENSCGSCQDDMENEMKKACVSTDQLMDNMDQPDEIEMKLRSDEELKMSNVDEEDSKSREKQNEKSKEVRDGSEKEESYEIIKVTYTEDNVNTDAGKKPDRQMDVSKEGSPKMKASSSSSSSATSTSSSSSSSVNEHAEKKEDKKQASSQTKCPKKEDTEGKLSLVRKGVKVSDDEQHKREYWLANFGTLFNMPIDKYGPIIKPSETGIQLHWLDGSRESRHYKWKYVEDYVERKISSLKEDLRKKHREEEQRRFRDERQRRLYGEKRPRHQEDHGRHEGRDHQHTRQRQREPYGDRKRHHKDQHGRKRYYKR